MSAPEMTKEEVEVLRDRTQRTLARCLEYPYKDWDGGRVKELVEEQLSLLAALDAAWKERDEANDYLTATQEDLRQALAQLRHYADVIFFYDPHPPIAAIQGSDRNIPEPTTITFTALMADRDRLTAQVRALEAERHFLSEQATKRAKDRDAL